MAKPNLSYLRSAILAVCGIPCGVLTGLTGMSSSPAMAPLLTWLVGSKAATLNGAVLTGVCVSAWTGLFTFAQAGDVRWSLAICLTIGSFAGAARAITALKSISSLSALRPVICAAAVAGALLMAAQATNLITRVYPGHGMFPLNNVALSIVGSLALGAIVGFVGQVGDLGAVLMGPALIYAAGLSIWQAEGTALFVVLIASLPTALIHAAQRQIDGSVAFPIALGCIFGGLYGSQLAVGHLSTGHFSDMDLLFINAVAVAACSLASLLRKPIVVE